MDNIKFLPLGSIVIATGGIQKLLIVGRALQVKNPAGKVVFCDYAAVPYPRGLTGPQVMYLNNNDIAKVIHKGYSDQEDKDLVDGIKKFLQSQ